VTAENPDLKVDLAGVAPELARAALRLAGRLREVGFTVFYAGGCVRDLLLGRPIHDVDIATAATPEQIQALFPQNRPVGAHFGVILVMEGGFQFQVATFRTDFSYRDGRHPGEVHFSTPPEDAERRDFTVNGLFLDPFDGTVTDYVGGLEDLREGVIRAIGQPGQRFAEDHLRLMRAIRFAAGLGFRIEPDTWTALRHAAPALSRISSERIQEELLKTLTQAGAAAALDLLEASGLLAVFLPEASAMVGVPQPSAYHPEGDVFRHVCLMFEKACYPLSPSLAMAVLLHDIAKPPCFRIRDRIRFHGHAELGSAMAGRIMARLKFSQDLTRQVSEMVAHHLQFMHVPKMRLSTLKRFLRLENFAEHLELHRLDCAASHGELQNYDFCRAQLSALPAETISPPLLVSGRDLIDLGLAPGPLFKQILEEVETLQLEEKLSERAEALEFVRQRFCHGKKV